jgi:hypothetical protein
MGIKIESMLNDNIPPNNECLKLLRYYKTTCICCSSLTFVNNKQRSGGLCFSCINNINKKISQAKINNIILKYYKSHKNISL